MRHHRRLAVTLLLAAAPQLLGCSLAAVGTSPAVEPASAEARALFDEIAAADRAMFDGFNAHDVERATMFFSADVEMYHDKGGLLSLADAVSGMKGNFAKNDGLRRELVAGSMEVFPIPGYGAIQVGAHEFCHREGDEDVCGTFRFLHVWQRRDGGWKITRAISYDH